MRITIATVRTSLSAYGTEHKISPTQLLFSTLVSIFLRPAATPASSLSPSLLIGV